MKKIILSATLLGSFYFANAQVGIGTPTPVSSTMLDITAADKGVLIPRVNLTALNVFAPVTGTQENGLLVFATGEKNDKSASDVKSGFYYWNVNKWERIVNQTQLDQVISNQADIAKIKALLDAAYGSNNLGINPTTGTHGGMVYTPGIPAVGTEGQPSYVAAVPAKFEYVKYVVTSAPGVEPIVREYQKLDATAGLISLIQGNETKTKIETIEGKQFYFAENYIGAVPTTIPSPLPAGMYLIDVVGGVVNNIEEIFTTETTIVINEGELNQQTFETVQEYIEYIISESNQPVGSMTFTQGTGTTTADKLASSSFTYILADGTVSPPITFSDLVKANETNTTLTKSNGVITAPITYTYLNEEATKNNTAGTVIEITADIISSITNNTDVQNAISNILNAGGNVYYGDHDNNPNTPNVFYTINTAGAKIKIEMSDIVVDATTINNNSSVEQINNVTKVKQNLGDKLTNTSVFTGDTVNIGGTEYFVYKGVFTTSIAQNTAVSSGITLDKAYFKVLSMNLTYANGVSANVTDLKPGTGTGKLEFNIGVGKMYNVLSTEANTSAEVIVEFASTVSPLIP